MASTNLSTARPPVAQRANAPQRPNRAPTAAPAQKAQSTAQAAPQGIIAKVRNFFGISQTDFTPNAQFVAAASPTKSGLMQLGDTSLRPKTSDNDLLWFLDQIASHGARGAARRTA